MHGHIREKRNTQLCKSKHPNFDVLKHIDVIHDWRGFSGEMIIYVFILGFSSPSCIKKKN